MSAAATIFVRLSADEAVAVEASELEYWDAGTRHASSDVAFLQLTEQLYGLDDSMLEAFGDGVLVTASRDGVFKTEEHYVE